MDLRIQSSNEGELMRIVKVTALFVCLAVAAFFAVTMPAAYAQGNSHAPVCPGLAGPDSANCHAHVVTDEHGQPMATSGPTGYGPAQFHGAYNLPTVHSGSGIPIIAIVD